ncbi:MAG: hypothetical protein EOM50_13140 [Erysipelotrichia bacterium]|nr:hypothetical protein [Erysipelotrichia bacterium]NCC55496.1 hypothetical protein [Erysipelotrichia bacterium]
MIKTITLTPCIEKRVRGKQVDEISYRIEKVSMSSGGIGIKVSKLLKAYHLENKAMMIAPSNIASFLKEDLMTYGIECKMMETANTGSVNLVFLDDDYRDQLCETGYVDDLQLSLFTSICKEEIHSQDVVVFVHEQEDISIQGISCFLEMLERQSKVQVLVLHPSYWHILKQYHANVLLVDEIQCLHYLKKQRLPLSEMMDSIQKQLTPFAKIIIYTLQYNDFLVFVEGQVYRVVCHIKSSHHTIYKEALITGIIRCYEEDGDLEMLCEQCMCLSVGMSISKGLSVPDEKSIAILKEKVILYSL